MPGRRPAAASSGPVLRHPRIYVRLGNSAADAANQMDPRLRHMVNEQQIGPVEAQQISGDQPHAKSLRALAARVDRREPIFVSPWRVVDLIVQMDPATVSVLSNSAVPAWLGDLVKTYPTEVGPRAAVTVSPDDTVKPSPPGTVPCW
jgi:hypothetical protein